jgi:cell wall-associated NlpC family hydrolase
MPSINRGQRYLALPLIGALVSSGLLVGSAGTATASTAQSAPVASAVTTTVSAAATATAVQSRQVQRKERRKAKIRRAVRIARNQIGDPYVYGQNGPNAFDCSGLTSYAFAKAGIKLPRSPDAQAARADRISKQRMKRGDLMFFYSGGDIYHVGIFMKRKDGERIILHASRPGLPIKRDPVWTSKWFPGTLRIRG